MANEVVVDALPYIDNEYEEAGMKEMVLAMIEEEKKRYRPTKNYLDHLPALDLHRFETDVMQKEFERLAQRLPMETLSMKRYELPPPPTGKLTDLSAWNECVENSYAQLEHQNTRIANLELMQEYSCESWKSYLEILSQMVSQSQKQLTDIKRRIQEVNWQRKATQTNAGDRLKRLESSWVGLVSKNYEIERACMEMEARAHQYQIALERRLIQEAETQVISEEANRSQSVDESIAESVHERSQDVEMQEIGPQLPSLPPPSVDPKTSEGYINQRVDENIDGEEIGPQPYYPDADKISNDPERFDHDDDDDDK